MKNAHILNMMRKRNHTAANSILMRMILQERAFMVIAIFVRIFSTKMSIELFESKFRSIKNIDKMEDVFLYKNEPNAAHDYLTNVQTKSADVYTER